MRSHLIRTRNLLFHPAKLWSPRCVRRSAGQDPVGTPAPARADAQCEPDRLCPASEAGPALAHSASWRTRRARCPPQWCGRARAPSAGSWTRPLRGCCRCPSRSIPRCRGCAPRAPWERTRCGLKSFAGTLVPVVLGGGGRRRGGQQSRVHTRLRRRCTRCTHCASPGAKGPKWLLASRPR